MYAFALHGITEMYALGVSQQAGAGDPECLSIFRTGQAVLRTNLIANVHEPTAMHSETDRLSLSTLVVATDKQVHTEVSGDTVILDTSSGRYFGLNSVGGFVWTNVQIPTQINAVIENVVQEYKIDREKARDEVLALIKEMIEVELVRVINSGSAG